MGRWLWRSRAAKEYGLLPEQIAYACRKGLLACREAGMGVLVDRQSLGANLEQVRALPRRWGYATRVARQYGLTPAQLYAAIALGLVREITAPNPHVRSRRATLVAVDDVEANIGRIKQLPRHTEEDRRRRREYARRWRLRRRLSFFCPRCGREVRPREASEAFEAAYKGELGLEEARRLIVIAHYRHAHTDYDGARLDVDRWLAPAELEGFSSFKELIQRYYAEVEEMDSWEREEWIDRIRRLKSLATERAKKHYNEIAAKMAAGDGLLVRYDAEGRH
jgi:hypothetical protein